MAEFWKYVEQCIRRNKKDAGDGEGTVNINDWEGFSLSHHASKDGKSFRENWHFFYNIFIDSGPDPLIEFE